MGLGSPNTYIFQIIEYQTKRTYYYNSLNHYINHTWALSSHDQATSSPWFYILLNLVYHLRLLLNY